MNKSGEYGLIYQIMEVSEHALYVLSKDDFRIIYENSKARKIFGDNLISLTCYQGIETKQLPCMNCPFILLQEGQEYVTERYLESFDMKVKVKANGLRWEDGSHVILCKILDSDELLQKKKEHDIVTQEVYAEKLRLSGELYQTVVNQMGTIVFEYNYIQSTFYTSSLFKDKFGLKEITNIDFLKDEQTASLIFEEDRDVYRMLFQIERMILGR